MYNFVGIRVEGRAFFYSINLSNPSSSNWTTKDVVMISGKFLKYQNDRNGLPTTAEVTIFGHTTII